jgi:hypothetical protein
MQESRGVGERGDRLTYELNPIKYRGTSDVPFSFFSMSWCPTLRMHGQR